MCAGAGNPEGFVTALGVALMMGAAALITW
jgi:hypothetical protein